MQLADHGWTLIHGFFANMGGFMVHEKANRYYVLDPGDIGTCLHNGQINITEAHIRDKSKGDILTKGFIVLQTTWFILQLIARAIERLPITELEIATLAFAILNGATYALWWNKPLDVQRPIVLAHHTLTTNSKHRRGHGRLQVSSVPFLHSGVHNKGTSTSGYILTTVGVLFGGIHCIAWIFHFPTTLERLLWQITSIITIVAPVVFLAVVSMDWNFPEIMQNITIILLFSLYTIARLFLLTLAFTTLRSLPPDAYTTVHWTTFVPHI